jgi:hypothetical protein
MRPTKAKAPAIHSSSSAFADLGVKLLHIDGWHGPRRSVAIVEHIGCPAFELCLPGRDLVRVNVELLGLLSDRPVALDRRNRHLGIEGGRVVPPRSFAHRKLLIRWHNRARCQADNPLTLPSEIVEPLL